MPFAGGTAGAHGDAMHQGDAKRDSKLGVAGLDADGHVLGKGWALQLPRSGSDTIMFYDRTSGEYAGYFKRIGAGDWEMWVSDAGVDARVLNFADLGEANGACRLDSNAFVRSEQVTFMIEEYSNHLGAVDNFTETFINADGTATEDAANHEMDLVSGTAWNGRAGFRTKSGLAFGAKPTTANIILQNLVLGTNDKFSLYIGFKANHEDPNPENAVLFLLNGVGVWSVITADDVSFESTVIADVVAGDVLSITVVTGKAMYFVNGVLVATHEDYVPTNTVKLGSSLLAYDAGAVAARTVSIDYMAMKRFV